MNVRQHNQNIAEVKRLQDLGFEFEVTADGYFVKFRGQGIGGGSVMLPRAKPLHPKHAEANCRDNLLSAILTARSSEFYRELSKYKEVQRCSH